jgi:hypothetical protein
MKATHENPSSPSAGATGSDALAIGAAWLDAELFMRTGDISCKHSTRLLGYRPGGVESADLGRRADSPNTERTDRPGSVA